MVQQDRKKTLSLGGGASPAPVPTSTPRPSDDTPQQPQRRRNESRSSREARKRTQNVEVVWRRGRHQARRTLDDGGAKPTAATGGGGEKEGTAKLTDAERATRARILKGGKFKTATPPAKPKPKTKQADQSTLKPTPPADPQITARPSGRRRDGGEGQKRQTKPQAKRRQPQERRQGKITISQALEGGEKSRQRSLASIRRAREREKARTQKTHIAPAVKQSREVIIPDVITVQELSNRMAERAADVIKQLMQAGVMATVTQTIDAETAELITLEMGHKPHRVSEADIDISEDDIVDDPETLIPRPPVVTVMGHVDHGKTSLLDAIREADVAASESGGITQHIGAYKVTTAAHKTITFIDTPGHEAFTEMRVRGANITDIVVLVVAADDGVKAQTIEAIRHAKAANCPIIVAVNKCDKEAANPKRVREELLEHEVMVEGYGGEVQSIDVSAKGKTGLDQLIEAILLQGELLDLKANPNRPAEAVVIESKLERGRGSIASALVTKGTLEVGQIFVVGAESGRVRAMVDDRGKNVKTALPGDAVEVFGLNATPLAGDKLSVVESEARAREVSEYRKRVMRQSQTAATARGSVEQMLSAIASGEAMELPLVIKADVHGSLEAIKTALDKLATEKIKVRVLSSGVGGINESDISLVAASKGIAFGFNVRANPQARVLAKRDGVDIRYHSIIYELIDEVKSAMSGMLSPHRQEKIIGYAEIKEVFDISKIGKVAGCMVTEGVIKRGCPIRLIRDSVVAFEGEIKTLRRFKDEVKEVREGQECGVGFANYGDLNTGDSIECFEIEEVAQTL